MRSRTRRNKEKLTGEYRRYSNNKEITTTR